MNEDRSNNRGYKPIIHKLIADANYKGFRDFDRCVAAIHMYQSHVVFNKPISVGTCVLNLSKLLMYGEIKAKYG